ncbi:MAG: hypothetical protein ACREGR_02140 [Minisyncoccia bacterium]
MTEPLKPEVVDAVANLMLNFTLRAVDILVQEKCTKPETQMGVLMLAQAAAFRRVCKSHGVTNGIQKRRLLKLAVRDFESKIRLYGFNDSPSPANDEKA